MFGKSWRTSVKRCHVSKRCMKADHRSAIAVNSTAFGAECDRKATEFAEAGS